MAEYVKANKVTSYIKGYAQRSIDLGSFDLVDDILTICENIEKMSVADVVSRETHEAVQKALVAFAETDVVQIVRCKNCLNWVGNAGRFVDNLTGHCFLLDLTTINSDYCSYGIRRADNENL